MTGRAATRRLAVALVAALAACGCGATKLPPTAALRDQSATQQRLDAIDCRAEMGSRLDYNGDDSEALNVLRHVFTLGAGGAALGGLATGFSPATGVSSASAGLIAGSGAGVIAGGVLGIGGRSRFERAWIACMESRGYAIVAPSGPIQ
jgi:predicted small lipoprotein YifL